jgi:hypothetical protein
MTAAHLKEIFALFLIGEGVVGSLYPDRYTRLWGRGDNRWARFLDWWADRPALLRALWVAQAGVGLWLAARQLPPANRGASRPSRLTPGKSGSPSSRPDVVLSAR